jgi:hypothetical protein
MIYRFPSFALCVDVPSIQTLLVISISLSPANALYLEQLRHVVWLCWIVLPLPSPSSLVSPSSPPTAGVFLLDGTRSTGRWTLRAYSSFSLRVD